MEAGGGLQQLETQLQAFAALQQRHETERQHLAVAHQTESTTLADKQTAESRLLHARHESEQQEFWRHFSDLQTQVQAELSREQQRVLTVSLNSQAGSRHAKSL